MRVEVPFDVEYLTPGPVPISDVIESLQAIKLLVEEGGYNLQRFVPGLSVEKVQVNVQAITQESPLRELYLVSLFVAFQTDLQEEVPALIELATGFAVPDGFRTITTVSILIALFYGAAYVKDLMSGTRPDSAVKRQLAALVTELAQRTGTDEDHIKKLLDERYKPKGRIKALSEAALGFFKPSKSQNNAPIRVDDRQIPHETVSDVAENYAYEEVLEEKSSREFPRVQLEVHAQDRDRDQSGWAAVPKGISDKRLRMKLMDGVSPAELWGKNHVNAAIIVKYEREGADMVPKEIHLTRLHES